MRSLVQGGPARFDGDGPACSGCWCIWRCSPAGAGTQQLGSHHACAASMPTALTGVPSLLQVVAYNKMDVPESSDYWDDVRQFLGEAGVAPDDVLATSAATAQGVTDMVRRVRRVLDALPAEVRAGPQGACLPAQMGAGDRQQCCMPGPVQQAPALRSFSAL